MVEAVGAFPDQSRQRVGVMELDVDPHGIGRGGDDRGHHRPREIDCPEARVEPLDEVRIFAVAPGGEPECHGRNPQKSRSARRTELAT
jgi:hypothetical protein